MKWLVLLPLLTVGQIFECETCNIEYCSKDIQLNTKINLEFNNLTLSSFTNNCTELNIDLGNISDSECNIVCDVGDILNDFSTSQCENQNISEIFEIFTKFNNKIYDLCTSPDTVCDLICDDFFINSSLSPTITPILAPSISTTLEPTIAITQSPTLEPTIAPTLEPTIATTLEPTIITTLEPTIVIIPTIATTPSPTIASPTIAITPSPTETSSSSLIYLRTLFWIMLGIIIFNLF